MTTHLTIGIMIFLIAPVTTIGGLISSHLIRLKNYSSAAIVFIATLGIIFMLSTGAICLVLVEILEKMP